MSQQIDLFLSSLQAFWSEVAMFAPKLLAALLLMTLGWFIARLVKAGIKRLLETIRFKSVAEKSGLEALARAGGMNVSLANLISETVYWLVILIVAISVANSLGLNTLAGLLNRVVLYLPNIVIAILILAFGILLARLVNQLLFAWLHKRKIASALMLSTGSEYAIQVFVLFVALEQLDIGTQLLTAAFSIAFGGVVFALSLAFGLGGKEWAAQQIQRWSSRENSRT